MEIGVSASASFGMRVRVHVRVHGPVPVRVRVHVCVPAELPLTPHPALPPASTGGSECTSPPTCTSHWLISLFASVSSA